MKKLLCILLALVMLMSLCACSKEQEAEGKSQGESKLDTLENVDRYFLYVEDNKLYCLDTEKGKTEGISLDFPVADISNAMVCDNNQTMIARINKNEETAGLVYLGDESKQAIYLGDNTQLVRMSKDGEVLFYLKMYDESRTLYYYDAKKNQSERIIEKVQHVSVSEDGSRAFVTVIKDDQEKLTLYYLENGKLQKIADDIRWNVNASPDCTAVAYQKWDERDQSMMNGKAYIWTKRGKARELPFYACEILVFDEENVYYFYRKSADGTATQYYYDGKESHLLSDESVCHGHKIGKYMYGYRALNENGEVAYYLAYKGKTLETSTRNCPQQGLISFLSPDDKCIYGWDQNGIMYQVELNAKGQLKETELRQMDGYSPRQMKFQGDAIVYPKEQALYMNDEMIAEEYEDYTLSTLGDVLVYKKGGTLFRYADGKTTEFSVNENNNVLYPAKGRKVISWQKDGSLTLHDKAIADEKSLFGENITQLVQVHTWTFSGSSNYAIGAERTGVWFHRDCGSIVWNR